MTNSTEKEYRVPISDRVITEQETAAVIKSFQCFRDSGCRLLVPRNYVGDDLLIDRLSGHWIIAPRPSNLLGFSFSEDLRIPSGKFPMIHTQPYGKSSEIGVHIDHEDYFIFRDYHELAKKGSISNASKEMKRVNLRWMIQIGATIVQE